MMTDPIADLLIQIKNSYLVGKAKVSLPYSGIKQSLAKLLSKEGYVGNIKVSGDSIKKTLIIELIYDNKEPKFTHVVRVSKPGKRVYARKDKLPKVLGGLGITVVSTSMGLLTDREARRKGLGGELICKIW